MGRVEHIGDATLYLGDCIEILPTLGKVDAVVTDPPYGMAYVSARRKHKHKEIENDGSNNALLWACRLDVVHSNYIFHRWDNIKAMPKPRSLIVWEKNNWGSGDLNGEHARSTEYLSFYRGPDHRFPSGRPADVIRCAKSDNSLHPTQKPVALMRTIISWTLGRVVDPFMGSGTTGVACASQGRKFIGIEIDEGYFDIACKRIEEAYRQADLFITPPEPQPSPKQEELL